MPWKRMLALVTGEIEESLLARVEYLIEENRVLRNQLQQRVRLTDAERRTLAEKAVLPVALSANSFPHQNGLHSGADRSRMAAGAGGRVF